jgi:hypothetical protein
VTCSNAIIVAAHIRPHSTTTGVSSFEMPCSSGMSVGPNDYAIALGQVDLTSTFLPVIGVVKVDITPIEISEVGSVRRSVVRNRAPATLPQTPTLGATKLDPRGRPLGKP